MVTRLPERHITGPDAIRRPSPAGRRLFYPVTRSASFRCARDRAGRPGETVIPACPGPDVPAAQRSDEWTGESSFRRVNSALWRIGRYGAMGCVGPRPGTPPSESDSRSADALVTGIFDPTPGAAPKRRVHGRRTAGPGKVHHGPAQTMTGGFQAAGQLTWIIFPGAGSRHSSPGCTHVRLLDRSAGHSGYYKLWIRDAVCGRPVRFG